MPSHHCLAGKICRGELEDTADNSPAHGGEAGYDPEPPARAFNHAASLTELALDKHGLNVDSSMSMTNDWAAIAASVQHHGLADWSMVHRSSE